MLFLNPTEDNEFSSWSKGKRISTISKIVLDENAHTLIVLRAVSYSGLSITLYQELNNQNDKMIFETKFLSKLGISAAKISAANIS